MALEMAVTVMAAFEASCDKKRRRRQQKVIEKLATLGSPKTDSLIVWLSISNPAQPFGQKPVLLLSATSFLIDPHIPWFSFFTQRGRGVAYAIIYGVKLARSRGLIEKDGEWHCGSESESLQEVGADGRKKLPPRLSWPWGRKSHLGFLPSRKRGPSPLASPNQLVHLWWQGWMDRWWGCGGVENVGCGIDKL